MKKLPLLAIGLSLLLASCAQPQAEAVPPAERNPITYDEDEARSWSSRALIADPGPPVATTEGELAWYLPRDVNYAADFPKPADVLGWEVGTWHVRHDQLVHWFERVAQDSPRATLTRYGSSFEDRPLLLAAFSSPENLARLDELRRERRESILAGDDDYDGPNVVWMGYSVHGNESSGSNAAVLLAYHLAAAQGEAVEAFLERTIVLIDPCLNPDGLSRFAHWANGHKGAVLVGDSAHREHTEGWPSGRTNHYWADLNRDWLLLTHRESQGRVAQFQSWLPSLLTDYHEMGTDSTYFFQPGIPSRQNPLTPDRNLQLTREVAKFHAKALDDMGSLYFTEESFDDFYYGKGSTYPDLHGAVGILFEQASSRGHLQENSYGGISFPFTIRNQFTTSLSTLAASDALRGELHSWQREFYRTASEEGAASEHTAYLFGDAGDPARAQRMVEILRAHGIQTQRVALPESMRSQGAGELGFAVPLAQPQYRLIRALFETRTSWPDNTFYDVSSWNLPMSFGLPYEASSLAIDELQQVAERPAPMLPQANAVAWIFEWRDARAPALLEELLQAGVRARVSTKSMSVKTTQGVREIALGSIVVARGVQAEAEMHALRILEAAALQGVQVQSALGGLTPSGVDLGSRSLRAIEPVELALLVGPGVSTYEAGQAWFELDRRIGMPVTLLERSSALNRDLSRYSHLVLVGGATGGWGDREEQALRDWVRAGGTLVAIKNSAVWATEHLLDHDDEEESADGDEAEAESSEESMLPRYADYEELRAVHQIAGAIFDAQFDETHPICFGVGVGSMPVFRDHTLVLPESEDPLQEPMRYSAAPLLSGYCSEENQEHLRGRASIRAGRLGGGSVVALLDNPNFRGVWWGTRRLFSNAIYFGPILKRTSPLRAPGERRADGESSLDSHGHGPE